MDMAMMNQGDKTLQVPLCRRQMTAELNGDFSLPDYQPEIRRLLRITATVQAPTRYAGSGSVDLSGSVDYFVLYAGNDGGLYCAPLSAEYRMNVPFEGKGVPADPPVVICTPRAENVAGRVTAPRRLNIRCRLGADVTVMGEVTPGSGDGADMVPGSLERLEGSAQAGRLFSAVGETLELTDDMITSPGEKERVICADGQVMVTEAAAGAGTVTCRGEVVLRLTVTPMESVAAPDEVPLAAASGQDGESKASRPLPRVLIRKVPFSQTIDVPGVTPACRACARGTCDSLSVQAEEDKLHTDFGVVLDVLAQQNETVTYVRDSFSTDSESSCTYETYTPDAAVDCVNGNFTLSDSLPLTDAGVDAGAAILDVTASAFPESVTVERDRCILTGTCRAQLLTEKGGEFGSVELTLPFRYETATALSDPDAALTYNACTDVISCRARMDGERIGLDAEIAVALRTAVPAPLTVQGSVTLGPGVRRAGGEYVICYPAPSDTLWTVAKRYRVPVTALSAANELKPDVSPDAPDSLAGVKYLIV